MIAYARAGVVALFLLVAAASVAITLPGTWRWLSEQHADAAALTPVERIEAAGFNNFLPVAAFDFFRSNLRRGDRFYMLARPGSTVRGVDFPTAARTFGRYYLLPAVLVDDPREATVVLAVARRPQELGLRYKSVVVAGDGQFVVARVRDPA